ncbi:MAG: hypothetical protein AW09_001199 [Candidatus Accumulibacter phosphatis]|uniref:Uncharacterized protein n=1 Tax=Candidatus Accumulibacter phosphatis TaxID=327160 RepID=A0A080LZU5_9PROT|nr:MAG: hypothetical protein AW09_001199 [Candidatus Accumulibacter phosphatis]
MLKVRAGALEERVIARHPEEAQTNHQHTGDGATLEGDIERRRNAATRRFCGAHVGPHGNIHADKTGRTRKHRTDQKANGHQLAERKPDQDKKYRADETNGRVLFGKVCRSAFLNGFGDLLHAWVAGWQRKNPLGHCGTVKHRNDSANQREHQS